MDQPDFTSPEYLQSGTARQQQAYAVLAGERIFETLCPFDPVLVGTVPINIDLPASDLDIICCFTDQDVFINHITENFSAAHKFTLTSSLRSGIPTVVAAFRLDTFPVEIFAQPVATTQQMGYRHMLIEHRILLKKGEAFRLQIIALKRNGYKTEPAFAHALGLAGDPYEAILQLEKFV